MSYEPVKFHSNNPKNTHERLVLELENDLIDTMKAFVELNKNSLSDLELFVIIRDGSIAFAGRSIAFLEKLLAGKNQTNAFINSAREIFECYLKEIEKKDN